MTRSTQRKMLFAAKFLGAVVLSYAVVALNPVNDHVVVPFTELITAAAGAVVRVIEPRATWEGTTIASHRFAIDVKNGCNGIETMILFAAAVLAFPASARNRVLGLLAGVLAIQVLNVLRLVSLFWLGSRHPDLFRLFHVAVWQAVIMLAGVAMFVTWSSAIALRQTADRA